MTEGRRCVASPPSKPANQAMLFKTGLAINSYNKKMPTPTTPALHGLVLVLIHLHGCVDTRRAVDPEDAHPVHGGHLGDDADEEDRAVHNDIERLVVRRIAGNPSDDRGDEHHELLGGRPGDPGVQLLVERHGIVFTLC